MVRALVVGTEEATTAALGDELHVTRVEGPGAALARAATDDVDVVVAGPETDRPLALLRRVRDRTAGAAAAMLVGTVDGPVLDRAREAGVEVVAVGPDGDRRDAAAGRVRRLAADRRVERERSNRAAARRVPWAALRRAAGADSPAAFHERLCAGLVDGRGGYDRACVVGDDGAVTVAGVDPAALSLPSVPEDGEVRTRTAEAADGVRGAAVVPLTEETTLRLGAARRIDGAERERLAALGTVAGSHLQTLRGDDAADAAALGDALAHELGNHVQVASLRLEGLRSDDDGDTTGALDDVAAALDRVERVGALLRVVGAGRVESESTVDVAARARAAWERVGTAAATLDANAGGVRAEPPLLDVVVENLLRNAVEHAPTDVAVSVGPLDDGFYVADDGPGLSAEERERALEWGYTGDDGSGVGLALVRRVADAHGWTVELGESAAGGARVEVRGATTAE